MTNRRKGGPRSSKSLTSGLIDTTPDLTNEQRQGLRNKNLESLMANKRVREELEDHIVATAFGDKEASPSERNFALGVITDSVYGKHRGVEPTEKTNQNIDITINGKPFDPVTKEFGALADEAKAERDATIARLRGEVVATQESGDGS